MTAESEGSGQSEYESATEEADQSNNAPEDHLTSLEVQDVRDTALRRTLLSANMSSRESLEESLETYGRANAPAPAAIQLIPSTPGNHNR